jgi:hypothetical protein
MVFVGFSDDGTFVRLGVAVFVLVVFILVGVSQRRDVADDAGQAPVEKAMATTIERKEGPYSAPANKSTSFTFRWGRDSKDPNQYFDCLDIPGV